MNNILKFITFYLTYSKFKEKNINYLFLIFSYVFSFYLIIQSIVKLSIYLYDPFNIFYLVCGIGYLCYNIYTTFKPSYIMHRNIKKLFNYRNISHFYEKQGVI